MTKKIQLSQGKFALVDDDDYEYLSKWKWHFHHGYACRNDEHYDKNGNRKPIRMHRVVMKTPEDMEVDHLNGETTDNRKSNLRNCFHNENMKNMKVHRNSISGYKGVTWWKIGKKWRARIRGNGKEISLGYYDNPESAAKAYDIAAKKYFGDFAFLNFPEE